MIAGTIYTEPYSAEEMLLIEGEPLVGAAYDPRLARLPTAWSSECRHCIAGRSRDVSIHVKRTIALLLTRRCKGILPQSGSPIYEYRVPSNSEPDTLRHWKSRLGQHAHVVSLDHEIMRASQTPYEKIVYESDEKHPHNNIVHKAIRFLFSGRAATPKEIIACAQPLAARQAETAKRRGFRHVCDKINWQKILDEVKKIP